MKRNKQGRKKDKREGNLRWAENRMKEGMKQEEEIKQGKKIKAE